MGARTWPTRPSTRWTWTPGTGGDGGGDGAKFRGADRGDTTSIGATLCEVMENLSEVSNASAEKTRDSVKPPTVSPQTSAECSAEQTRDSIKPPMVVREAVTDKGYHSNDVMCDLAEMGIRSYASEPDRGRRNWKGKKEQRDAVYANRRRIKGERGKRLLRKRGELLERPFAHCYDTGGMRRTHLRGHQNILKRLLIHVGASNLGLLMRRQFGFGTPRALQDLAASVARACAALANHVAACMRRWTPPMVGCLARHASAPLAPPYRLAA